MPPLPKVTPEEWELHRPEIERLFMNGHTYADIAARMKMAGSLDVNVSAYQRQFKKWKLTRNIPMEQSMMAHQEIEERARAGKSSEVHVGGTKISDAKQRRLKRGFIKHQKKQAQLEMPVPPLDQNVERYAVRTPPPDPHNQLQVSAGPSQPATAILLGPDVLRDLGLPPKIIGERSHLATSVRAEGSMDVEFMNIDEVPQSIVDVSNTMGDLSWKNHALPESFDVDMSEDLPSGHVLGGFAQIPSTVPRSSSTSMVRSSSSTSTYSYTIPSEILGGNIFARPSAKMPTRRLDHAIEANFSMLQQHLVWPETLPGTLPADSQLQKVHIPNRLHVLQEIGRLLANNLMEAELFFNLADYLGMEQLLHIIREAKKWSGHSPAETSFHEKLRSWTLKYAIVKYERPIIAKLLPYTIDDLRFAICSVQGWVDLVPVILSGLKEFGLDDLWNVLQPPCDNQDPWRVPLSLVDLGKFLRSVKQQFPRLEVKSDTGEARSSGTRFGEFLFALQDRLPRDGSWSSSALESVLKLLTKMGAKQHVECHGTPYTMGKKTALQEAVTAENHELVDLLLQQGADPNQPMSIGPTAPAPRPKKLPGRLCTFTSIAMGRNHKAVVEIVKILINLDGSVFCDCPANNVENSLWAHQPPPGRSEVGVTKRRYQYLFSPLLEAIGTGNVQLVSLLLNNGASLIAKQPNFGSLPALQVAAHSGNMEVLQLLLTRDGVDPNAVLTGDDALPEYRPPICIPRTALEAASLAGHLKVIKALISAGARIVSCEGRNALEFALKGGHLEAARVMWKRIDSDDQQTRMLWGPRLEPKGWCRVLPNIDLVDAVWSGNCEKAEKYLDSNGPVAWLSLRLPAGSMIHTRHNGTNSGHAWEFWVGPSDSYEHRCSYSCNYECNCKCDHSLNLLRQYDQADCRTGLSFKRTGVMMAGAGGFQWDSNLLPYVCRLNDHIVQVKMAKLLLKSGCSVDARVPCNSASKSNFPSTLELALRSDNINFELVRTLVDANADAHLALHETIFIADRECEHELNTKQQVFLDLLQILVEKGFRFPPNCTIGDTAWNWAIYTLKDVAAIKSFQQLGLDTSIFPVILSTFVRWMALSKKGVDPAIVKCLAEGRTRAGNTVNYFALNGGRKMSPLDDAVQLGNTEILETILNLWENQFGDSSGNLSEDRLNQVHQGDDPERYMMSISGSLILKDAVKQAICHGRLDCLSCILHNRQRYFSREFTEYITWFSRHRGEGGISQYLEEFGREHASEGLGRRDPISLATLLMTYWADHKTILSRSVGRKIFNPYYLDLFNDDLYTDDSNKVPVDEDDETDNKYVFGELHVQGMSTRMRKPVAMTFPTSLPETASSIAPGFDAMIPVYMKCRPLDPHLPKRATASPLAPGLNRSTSQKLPPAFSAKVPRSDGLSSSESAAHASCVFLFNKVSRRRSI